MDYTLHQLTVGYAEATRAVDVLQEQLTKQQQPQPQQGGEMTEEQKQQEQIASTRQAMLQTQLERQGRRFSKADGMIEQARQALQAALADPEAKKVDLAKAVADAIAALTWKDEPELTDPVGDIDGKPVEPRQQHSESDTPRLASKQE